MHILDIYGTASVARLREYYSKDFVTNGFLFDFDTKMRVATVRNKTEMSTRQGNASSRARRKSSNSL